ncbi:unnamed protein product [Caenorhabditis nigoni]
MANAQQIPLHMREVSRTGFVQRLRRFPAHHPHKGKFNIQQVIFCYDDQENNGCQVTSETGETWQSYAFQEALSMLAFIIKFAIINFFESKGNLDLMSAHLEMISTSQPFQIRSIGGTFNNLTKKLLQLSDKVMLTDVQLSDPRKVIPIEEILQIPLPNVSSWSFESVSYPKAISEMAKRWILTDAAPETKMTIKMRGSFDWMLNFKTSFFSKILEESQDKISIAMGSNGKVIELNMIDKNTFELSVVKISRHLDPHFRDKE